MYQDMHTGYLQVVKSWWFRVISFFVYLYFLNFYNEYVLLL